MELLTIAKSKCYITTDEAEVMNRLQRIVDDAQVKISRLIGAKNIDFTQAGEERELFLNYVWYAWNDAENEFKTNYLDDILALRLKYEVEQYADEEEVIL